MGFGEWVTPLVGEHQHRHAANIFANAVETHGDVQVQVLDWAVDEMNPAPVVVKSDDDEHALMDAVFRRDISGIYAIEDAAAGRQVSGTAERSLAYNVERLKQAAGQGARGGSSQGGDGSVAAGANAGLWPAAPHLGALPRIRAHRWSLHQRCHHPACPG